MLATVFPFNTGKARKETTAKTCGENIKSHIFHRYAQTKLYCDTSKEKQNWRCEEKTIGGGEKKYGVSKIIFGKFI